MSPRGGTRLRRAGSRVTLGDVAREAVAGVVLRPTRIVLTLIGITLGVASLIVVLGISKSGSTQILARFDALRATEVQVLPTVFEEGSWPFPQDVEQRLLRLNGVRAVGVRATLGDPPTIAPRLVTEVGVSSRVHLPVVGASPGLFDATHAVLTTGRFFDAFHSERSERVAVIGSDAAAQLGLGVVDHQAAIFVGEDPFTVIGIIGEVGRQLDLRTAIVIPLETARVLFGSAMLEPTIVIDVAPGAAEVVGRQAPVALAPQDVSQLRSVVVPMPGITRQRVESDVGTTLVVLSGVLLLIGIVGIANTTLVSVVERIPEIGLRRALGARRVHVAFQFLLESLLLGTTGGIVGTVFGLAALVFLSDAQGWIPVIDPWVLYAGGVLGAGGGLVAGVYPSWRAAGVEPAIALRGV